MISTTGSWPIRSRTASAAPMIARSQHRVDFLELPHPPKRCLELGQVPSPEESSEERERTPQSLDLQHQLLAVGQKLVQRWVEQPDRYRQPVHRLEDSLEVLSLERKQVVQGSVLLLDGLGHDHRPHLRLTSGLHEHVLGAA